MAATTFGAIARISDTDGDGLADRYNTWTNKLGCPDGDKLVFHHPNLSC